MLTTTDIEDIVATLARQCGIAHVLTETPLVDDKAGKGIAEETVVVHAKARQSDTYWRKGFVEVNLCVPDFAGGNRRKQRLRELEEQAARVFAYGSENGSDIVATAPNGTTYRISVDNIGTEQDKPLKCHFVNVRILFETFNIN